MRVYPIIFAVVVALAWPSRVPAAVLRVPEDYPSVLAGVDAAAAGDSVLVGSGMWRDTAVRTIVYLGQALTLQVAMVLKPGVTVLGTTGAGSTVLDGGAQVTHAVATVIHASPGSVPARVVGFTITGGGEGVATGGSNFLELDGCRIQDNGLPGIVIRNGDLTLVNCVVSGNDWNQAPPLAGAVFGFDYNITCIGCTFEHNRGPGLSVRLDQGWGNGMVVTLQDCVFQDHTQRGALLGDAPFLDIERCLFLRNSISGGTNGPGGGLDLGRCTGSVRFCTFAFDSAGGGGGAHIGTSQVRVENNTFYGCYAGTEGGALFVDGPDQGTANNIFAYSTGRRGAVAGPTPNPQSGCNVYWANSAGDGYGGWVPGATDIHADPLFCDPVTLDFHLQAASPAAPANSNGCGLIGTFDVNCGPVSVEPRSWGRVKSLFR
ncbi:MAG: right-handed parallel beta-helix repeat-containing protein [bacterium]